MNRFYRIAALVLGISVFGFCDPDVLWLGSSGYAPPDVGHYPDAVVAVSDSHVQNIGGQFLGLFELASQTYSFEEWPGREMADCVAIPWGHRCQIQTGDLVAFYDFRSNDFSEVTHLESLDLQMDLADQRLLSGVIERLDTVLGKGSANGLDRYYWKSLSGAADIRVDTRQSFTRFYWRPQNSLVIQPETVLLPLQS